MLCAGFQNWGFGAGSSACWQEGRNPLGTSGSSGQWFFQHPHKQLSDSRHLVSLLRENPRSRWLYLLERRTRFFPAASNRVSALNTMNLQEGQKIGSYE